MKAAFTATDEVLVVTGGARGIGAALARSFAEAGGHSIVLDVDPSEELSGISGVEQHRVDVSDRDGVFEAIADVTKRHGRIDAVVAGAAVQPRASVEDMEPEVWRRALSVNLDGVVWTVQATLPHLKAAPNGAIVAFASGLARVGRAEASAYAATKAALTAFSKSLAAELADERVRVNVIFPGVIDTEQFRAANPSSERAHWESSTGIGVAEDVVGPLMFLLSDAASMTGSELTRDRVYPAIN